jgi:serine/threonine protein kinase
MSEPPASGPPASRPGPTDDEIREAPEGRRIAAELRYRLFGTKPAVVSIGPYRIERRIGQGGMGTVYAAVHEPSGRRRAVKWVASTNGAAQARLRREARAMMTLSHPNIVAVDDCGTWEGGWYLAMDLVEGSNLRQWLRTGVTPARIIDCIVQAADGLGHAHAHGIVHRDVKPDNLLVALDGTIRITDFGLARALVGSPLREHSGFETGLTRTGTNPGTVGYAAPEQLLGQPVTAATDQFGLAATAFEAIFGRPAFTGRNPDDVAVAILEGDVSRVGIDARDGDPVLEAIIVGLAVDPARRHPDIAAFGRALSAGAERPPPRRSWRSRLFGKR